MERVGFVVDLRALVAVDTHRPISDIVGDASFVGAVDGNLFVVSAKAVAMSVGVREETALEHLVEGRFNAGNEVRGREGSLLSLSVEVLGVFVENELAYRNERVVPVRPHFSDIEHVKAIVDCIFLGHHLHEPGPCGEVALFDVVVQIVGGKVLVFQGTLSSFIALKVLDALVGLKVVLD